MKKTMIALFGLAVAVSLFSCQARKGQPEVIAHRGFWKAEPEVPHNSIASLRNAIELGCFGTEFDIWVTTDGVPVIFHDSKTKSGVVLRNVTYAELMEQGGLLANGETIPTLEEYLAVWEGSNRKVKLILEIKSHGDPETDAYAARRVQEIVEARGIEPSLMEYIAFSRDVCKTLRDMETGVPVAFLNGDLSPADARSELGVTGIDYNMKVFREHPEWIGEARDLGMTVNVWTVNEDADMREFIDAGVDYITTDHPDILMQKLAGGK